MSEDEATNKLKELVTKCKKCKFATCENCEINWNEVQAIEKVLDELETYKRYYEELTTGQVQSAQLLKKYVDRDELEKKDKIIDAMTEYIDYQTYRDNEECEFQSLNNIKCPDTICTDCIKQYFERKVKDE